MAELAMSGPPMGRQSARERYRQILQSPDVADSLQGGRRPVLLQPRSLQASLPQRHTNETSQTSSNKKSAAGNLCTISQDCTDEREVRQRRLCALEVDAQSSRRGRATITGTVTIQAFNTSKLSKPAMHSTSSTESQDGYIIHSGTNPTNNPADFDISVGSTRPRTSSRPSSYYGAVSRSPASNERWHTAHQNQQPQPHPVTHAAPAPAPKRANVDYNDEEEENDDFGLTIEYQNDPSDARSGDPSFDSTSRFVQPPSSLPVQPPSSYYYIPPSPTKQDRVSAASAQTPPTKETPNQIARPKMSSDKNSPFTRSSASRDESDYLNRNTPRTSRSTIGDGDGEKRIRIMGGKYSAGPVARVGDLEIQCPEGEIILNEGGGSTVRGDEGQSSWRFANVPYRPRANSQARRSHTGSSLGYSSTSGDGYDKIRINTAPAQKYIREKLQGTSSVSVGEDTRSDSLDHKDPRRYAWSNSDISEEYRIGGTEAPYTSDGYYAI